MRRIKRFPSKRSEILFRSVAILLPLISIVLLLSQTAFAQNTYVITDGERILIHTTSTTDPAIVLDEAGLSLGDDDTYTTQGGDGVSEITVRRNSTVTINNCGQVLTAAATNETVGALLTRMGIVPDENTTVSISLDAMVCDGMEIRLTHTVHSTEVYSRSVPFDTSFIKDESLPMGSRVIVNPGQNGEMICTADVTYQNGIETNRRIIKQILNRHPSPRIILVGTGDPLDDINFSQFAESEEEEDIYYEEYIPEYEEEYVPDDEPSYEEEPEDEDSGNYPVIGGGTITTASGEVLTYTHTMVVEATAYTKTDAGCDDWTATGTLARYGAIAVDPSVIPYGTRMYIVSNDGAYVYGIAVAEDCGGAINGSRVDLYFDTTAECFQFGRRDCTIYFLD